MTQYENQLSVVLAIAALSSAIIFAFNRPKQIKLESAGEYEPLYGAGHDYFDIVRQEDLIDGHPINAETFWKNMRRRKLYLSFVLALLVASQAIVLWRTAAIMPSQTRSLQTKVTSLSLGLAFSVYTLVVSLSSIPAQDVETHWPRVIHLSVLTTLATLLLGISAIIPSTPRYPSTNDLAAPNSPYMIYILNYTSLVLLFLSSFISTRTPHGPHLHYPPERIYSPKILGSSTPTVHNNVCGIVSASVCSLLLFSYTTMVVKLGYTSESLQIHDLPILPARFRAGYLFSRMRKATFLDSARQQGRDEERSKAGELWKWGWMWQREGSGWPLLLRLYRINKVAFLVQIVLGVISAFLWYAPAFFLQNLVKYLEDDPERNNISWGLL